MLLERERILPKKKKTLFKISSTSLIIHRKIIFRREMDYLKIFSKCNDEKDDDKYNNSSSSSSSNNNNSNNGDLMKWTNQRHSDFLRVMEKRFVRNMLKNINQNTRNNHNIVHHTNSRLDRFVPDISESTLDSAQNWSDRVRGSSNSQKERLVIRPHKISHDQVVPHLENKASDKGELNHK
ncbi:uncharacterized protein LOC130805961 [Amaranthus tricolor]|uniref:uncharacterized protein LOC130805961 n=1 Tax=Amaranthus tricolor TaxID=29722 RepID=UPI00258DF07D|nr:uncharacterized protein LOC130805961 [Amaranthus tricolor]